MDRSTIQEMLDSLDMQLASGKIDLDTYQKLTAKWQSKLTEGTSGQSEEGGAAESAFRPASVVERIACPECSAPLDDAAPTSGDVIRCGYCRATFTLKNAQEQTAKTTQEVRRWLDQVIVESGKGGTVDAASRRFIFQEKLFPMLQLDYRRSMEPYEDVQEHPLATLDLLSALPGFRAEDHILIRSPEALPRVRGLNLKVSSPLLADFTVAEEDRRKLQFLDQGASSLVYLANAAKLLLEPSSEAFSAVKENLMALHREYGTYLESSEDRVYNEYLQALRARLEADARMLDVMAAIFAPQADFAAQVYVDEMVAVQEQLTEIHRTADGLTYNPVAIVPLKMGLERDLSVAALLTALLRSYHLASRNRNLAFPAFYTDVRALQARLLASPNDISQVVSIIEQLTVLLEAQRGKETLRVIADWSWCDAQIEGGRKRGLFGGGESVREQYRYWHPFWCARIQYTVAKGTFLVSGIEQTGYGLFDATAADATPVLALSDSAWHPVVESSWARPVSGDGKAMLPPLVPQSLAAKRIDAAAHQIGNVRNVHVTVEGVLYIPADLVHYDSKAGLRSATYAWVSVVNPAAGPLAAAIQWFFERYQ